MLVSKVMILSNAETIKIMVQVGATPQYISSKVTSAFLRQMLKVLLKTFVVEFLVYAVLIMAISSFTNLIIISFFRVIFLTLVSALIFTLTGMAILYRQCHQYATKLHQSTADFDHPFAGG
jgi:hypothetical protein